MSSTDFYIRLEDLHKRLSEIEHYLSLGSSVPPGSESTLHGETMERTSETMARVFKLWNQARAALQKAMGELDAANQHVKILEESQNERIANCLRSCAQTIRENKVLHTEAVEYLLARALAFQMDLATQQADLAHAAQPEDKQVEPSADSEDLPEPAQLGKALIEQWARLRMTQPIGVHDYPSFVSCLRANFKIVFGEDAPFTDPQDMIQRMTAEIQRLRSLYGTV